MADTATSTTATAADPAGRPATARFPVRALLAVAGLVLALLGGFGLGRLGGGAPTVPAPLPSPATGATGHSHAPGTAPHEHGAAAAGSSSDVTGLTVSSSGYRLAPVSTAFPAAGRHSLRFRILGPDGAPVTSFAVNHDKPMHLIVVRRDLSGYQHVHPTMAADGTWSAPLAMTEAGVWRAYADFAVAGTGGAKTYATLGVDLTVAGALRPRTLPPPARTATVDGYTVTYAGTPKVATSQPLLFTVARDGSTAALERYLGAYGHLVVLREGDLGYVHVHPEDRLAGGAAKFWLAAPSAGRYRMFFDFQTGGGVHTAQFTVTVP